MFNKKDGEVVVDSWSKGVSANPFPELFASRIAAIRSEDKPEARTNDTAMVATPSRAPSEESGRD